MVEVHVAAGGRRTSLLETCQSHMLLGNPTPESPEQVVAAFHQLGTPLLTAAFTPSQGLNVIVEALTHSNLTHNDLEKLSGICLPRILLQPHDRAQCSWSPGYQG